MTKYIFRWIDWYLARYDYRRISIYEPPKIEIREYPVEVIREVEVKVEVPQYPVERIFIDVARELVNYWDVSGSPLSGEGKRHDVYARMIKLFPAAAKRDLALAIEYGLRELNG